MDTIQAAILNVKLRHYESDLKLRQEVAEKYNKMLESKIDKVVRPTIDKNKTSAWAQYSIRVANRDELQVELKNNGIPTAVHYPTPLHRQQALIDYEQTVLLALEDLM